MFTDDLIIYVENPRGSTKKNESSRVRGYMHAQYTKICCIYIHNKCINENQKNLKSM